jgi:hypothetical protein
MASPVNSLLKQIGLIAIVVALLVLSLGGLASAFGYKATKDQPPLNNTSLYVPASAECIGKVVTKSLQYLEAIDRAAQTNGVDPKLLVAIARHESDFVERAQSYVGAFGLMQLLPGTYRENRRSGDPPLTEGEDTYFLSVTSSASADQNEFVKGGPSNFPPPEAQFFAAAHFIASLQEHFKPTTDPRQRLTKVVAAYNAGQGAVDERGGVPPYPETQAFVRNVLGTYDAIVAECAKSTSATTPPTIVIPKE